MRDSFTGWFIVDRGLFLGHNGHHEVLKPWKSKTGIPKHAMQFDSEAEAQREIDFMQHTGLWPLCDFKAERRTWK